MEDFLYFLYFSSVFMLFYAFLCSPFSAGEGGHRGKRKTSPAWFGLVVAVVGKGGGLVATSAPQKRILLKKGAHIERGPSRATRAEFRRRLRTPSS